MYEMLTGSPPFYSRDKAAMFRNRLANPIEMKPYFTENAVSLLGGLLCNNPQQRLGVEGHQQIMDHAFFSNLDWNALAN